MAVTSVFAFHFQNPEIARLTTPGAIMGLRDYLRAEVMPFEASAYARRPVPPDYDCSVISVTGTDIPDHLQATALQLAGVGVLSWLEQQDIQPPILYGEVTSCRRDGRYPCEQPVSRLSEFIVFHAQYNRLTWAHISDFLTARPKNS